MNLWICTTQALPDRGREDAMIIAAVTSYEAASIAADLFTNDDAYADALPITRVFVARWDGRQAFEVRCRAVLAEFQCCGGGPASGLESLDGHWGGCPQAPEREGPQPVRPSPMVGETREDR